MIEKLIPIKVKNIQQAKDTLNIVKHGMYRPDSRTTVDIKPSIEYAVRNTSFIDTNVREITEPETALNIDINNSFTLDELIRQYEADKDRNYVLLNFASAKQPGGGFQTGANAQEESLARASALYECLKTTERYYYEPNRHNDNQCLYTDGFIYSRKVPFFKDSLGNLMKEPILADVLTCAAPNAGSARRKGVSSNEINETIELRIHIFMEYLARNLNNATIILGAFGCGVFKNNPKVVAEAFKSAISRCSGLFVKNNIKVVFAIPSGNANYKVFLKILTGRIA